MTRMMTIPQRTIWLLVVLCAAAAVPPNRRFARQAEGTEGTEAIERTETTEATEVVYCDPETPCAWSTYQDPLKRIYSYLGNEAFCICREGFKCLLDHEVPSSKVDVLTCKPS